MSSRTPPGTLFVVSAPSGTGKTTVVDRLVEALPGVERSRSYTSRPARPAEVEGVDYNFVSRPRFDEMIARREFLEWAEVFGNRYGTRRLDVEARLASGVDLMLVIDVQGGGQVREQRPEAVGVFLLPPTFEVLERRLRARSQDPEGAIQLRLATARSEITAVEAYEYVLVNENVDACVAELGAIVTAERARRRRRGGVIESIVGSFRTAHIG